MGLLLAVFLGGFFGFNAIATPERAGQMMEQALRKRYPNAEIKATVTGKSGKDVVRGRFKSVKLEMARLGAIDGVPLQTAATKAKSVGRVGHFEVALKDFTFDKTAVESASLTLDNVLYDLNALKEKNQINITGSDPGSARLAVTCKALDDLLAERFPQLGELHITMKEGVVRCDGKKMLPLVKIGIPFHMTARVEVRNTNELWIVDERILFEKVPGFTLPVGKLFELLNPVYVFDKEKKWPFEVRVTKMTADNDKIEVDAALKFRNPDGTTSSPDPDAEDVKPNTVVAGPADKQP